MSMKEINALRTRGEGDEAEVYIKGNGHAGWVRKMYLIAWLAQHGKLQLVGA